MSGGATRRNLSKANKRLDTDNPDIIRIEITGDTKCHVQYQMGDHISDHVLSGISIRITFLLATYARNLFWLALCY
jgi:hypothetical protein